MSERIEKARAKVDLSYVALTATSPTMSDEKAAQRVHAALDDLIAAVREDEREQCARILDSLSLAYDDAIPGCAAGDLEGLSWMATCAADLAKAIRRRSAP